MRSALRGI